MLWNVSTRLYNNVQLSESKKVIGLHDYFLTSIDNNYTFVINMNVIGHYLKATMSSSDYIMFRFKYMFLKQSKCCRSS